ncbi:unnamed protein product [Effrenium voratum]|nr:unnamed protein product [Effrenium voratum]
MAAKGLREVSQAAERAQGLAIHLADRLSTARTDLDSALSPSSVVRGIREVGYRASSVLQRLRSSTVELLSMEDGPTESAEVLGLSRQLWECWHSKHMALTAAERLYLTLLSESRRTAALMAELAAVQRLLQEEPTTELSRQKAVESCSAQIQAQALEAVKAFEGRARDYPCGCPHTRTGLLRISRREEDLSSVREAHGSSVSAEVQACQAPAMGHLTAAAMRRVVEFMAQKQLTRKEVLRSTHAYQAFSSWGAALRPNVNSGDLHDRSKITDDIQDFWSHAWLGNSWGKFLTLLVMYNGRPALWVGICSALLGIALCVLGILPGSTRGFPSVLTRYEFSVWGVPFGAAGVLLMVALWRARRRVFLDRICISNTDQNLKLAAIASLPGLLQKSESMLVLWDPIWPSRLWCVFELAAFLSLRKGAPKVCPTMMGPCTIVAFFLAVCLAAPLTLMPVVDFDYTLVGVCVAAAGVATAVPTIGVFRSYFRAVEGMEKTLRTLRVLDTRCACCDAGHVGSDGSKSFCDKEIICACITEWFGSTEAFEHYIQTDVTDVLVYQLHWCTFRYPWSCAIGMPVLWACLDIASFPLQWQDEKNLAYWITCGLCITFMVVPFGASWSKFLTYVFRHGTSWRHEVMMTLLVLICEIPFGAYVALGMLAPLVHPWVMHAGTLGRSLFFPGLMLPFVLLQFWVPKPPSFNPASAIHPEVHPETIAELSPEPPSCEELEAPIELEEEVPTDEACRGNVSRRQKL